jgi:hypothetical protein
MDKRSLIGLQDKVENIVDSLSKVKNDQKHFKSKLQEEQKKLAQLNTSAEATRVEFEVILVV